MNTPLVSIVMPVFNRPDDLRVMLDSIIANTYTNWELICVDDGSQEETKALLHAYSERDKRISVYDRDRMPKGAQTCRNMGLERANGTYVMYVDSDDYLAPYCMEQRLEALSQRPELDFMIFPSAYFVGEPAFCSDNKSSLFGYRFADDDLRLFLQRVLPFIVCTNLYRTDRLKATGVHWDEKMTGWNDSDYNIQLLLHGMTYDYAQLPPDYSYRLDINPSRITSKLFTKERYDNLLYAISKTFLLARKTYGRRYDKDVFHSFEFIITQACQNGDLQYFGDKTIDTLKELDSRLARRMQHKLCLTRWLCKIVPLRVSLKIAFLDYYWNARKNNAARSKAILAATQTDKP